MVASTPVAVGVIDVGSPKSGKLGWAILSDGAAPATGSDLDEFITRAADLVGSCPLVIGFEAPLFIPVRSTAIAALRLERAKAPDPGAPGVGQP